MKRSSKMKKMSPGRRGVVLLVAGAVILYAATAAVLLRLMPGPRTPADLMVVGSAAMLITLLAVFLVLILGWLRRADTFFRRRKK